MRGVIAAAAVDVNTGGRLGDETVTEPGKCIHHTHNTRPLDEISVRTFVSGQVTIVGRRLFTNSFYRQMSVQIKCPAYVQFNLALFGFVCLSYYLIILKHRDHSIQEM